MRRVIAVRLGALVLALTAAGVAAGAVPAAATPAQDPPSTGPATIELVDQTTWLRAGESFRAELRVVRPPPAGGLRVAVHDALGSRDDFRASLDGELGDVTFAAPTRPLATLAVSGAGVTTVGFGPEADLDQGVHPVSIEILGPGGDVVTRTVTYVVVLPPDMDGLTPLSVAVVVDVATPPALRPDGTVEIDAESRQRVAERVEALERAPRAPVTVAPRPETLDGLAAGDDQDAELLADLVAARGDRPVLARPYTDVHLGALRQAGIIGEANVQADSGAEVVRSRIGVEPVGGIWLPPSAPGDEGARVLTDLDIGRAVVQPDAVADAPGLGESRVPEQPVTLGEGGPDTMVNDTVLADRLTGDDGVLDAQRFVAELAMTWLERPAVPRGVVVRIPPDRPLDPDLVGRALEQLTERRAVRVLPLSQVFEGVPPIDGDAPPVATPAPQVSDDLRPVAARLGTARADVGGVTGVLGDAETGLSLEHSLLLATGADTPDDERLAYVRRVTDELADLTSVVRAPEEFRITLTSRSGTIPLNITNDSSDPVDVRIALESDQLEFPDGDTIYETLAPGATRIDVRVRVRTSGAFPLDIVITSPDGSIQLDETRFDIRSTAVSGVGLVLSIGAGLFLALWWIRNWRATTRSRRLVPADAPRDEGGAAAGHGPGGHDQGGASPSATGGDDPTRGSRSHPEDGYRPAHMVGHSRRP